MVAINETAYGAALMNLVLNAQGALSGENGQIIVNLGFEKAATVPMYALGESLDTCPAVCIEVIDNGCGMTPEIRDHIFEPFFSTKPKGKGLGLTNVLSTVREASGSIACESRVGEGSAFRIWLPVGSMATTDVPAVEFVTESSPRKLPVILVEDDRLLGPALQEMVESLGYPCNSFSTAESALGYFSKMVDGQHLLICDIQLPGMSGIDLLGELAKFGGYPTLMISGNETPTDIDILTQHERLLFLRKPITLEQVEKALTHIGLEGRSG